MHPPDMPSRSAQELHVTGKSVCVWVCVCVCVCVCYTAILIIGNRLKQDPKTAVMEIGEG
jgi:hypothetical protein